MDKIGEIRRQQISGTQSERNRPVTTVYTPDPTPSNSGSDLQMYIRALPITGVEEKEAGDNLIADVNGGLTGLNFAKTITTDDDRELETEDSEQKRLLEDAVIFVTKKKVSSRK